MGNNIASRFDPSQLVILSVAIIGIMVVLTLALAWARSKREEKDKIVDMDWDEERKKLEALAAEKLAKRHTADMKAAKQMTVDAGKEKQEGKGGHDGGGDSGNLGDGAGI